MAKPNFKNRTLWTGENLDIMRGMNSETVDLIYLDPPFNSNRDYAAPIGSEAAGAAFKDTWTLSDVDLAWHGEIAEATPALYRVIDAARGAHGKGMQSYLIMMAVRLLEMKRLLKPTGSIYLHCDPTASHYLKLVMDTVFGKDAFKNEIIWHFPDNFQGNVKRFAANTNTILFYTGTAGTAFTFNHVQVPLDKPKRRGGRVWSKEEGRVVAEKGPDGKPVYRTYTTKKADNVWTIGQSSVTNRGSKERTGYPTQKPIALLERIITASSNARDVVLDPFCGCATALIAAEKLDRQWVGIDLSPKAKDLIQLRMGKELGLFSIRNVYREDVPRRTDQGKLPDYRTHKQTLFGRQEGYCAGCRGFFEMRNFTVDHIIARSKGGTDHLDNLQLLCGACNSMKGTKTQEEFLALLKREGIR